jgi:hypothetical protein
MIENVADLIKFEPGVYIESNLTRASIDRYSSPGISGIVSVSYGW